MATLLATGIGLVTGAVSLVATAAVTGFAFAGGATAFQKIDHKIEDSQKPGTKIDDGDPRRARDQNPFNKTRFLDDIEKKEINNLIKNDPSIN